MKGEGALPEGLCFNAVSISARHQVGLCRGPSKARHDAAFHLNQTRAASATFPGLPARRNFTEFFEPTERAEPCHLP